MRELPDILAAFESLCAAGKHAALATVVSVEGSAYRRPGARMLIAEDGRCWGGVSGGCLDRDVCRQARGVMATGEPLIARYDTTDDEDLTAGVATGCRGVVEVFIEPVSPQSPGPLRRLARVIRERQTLAIATVLRTPSDLGARAGSRLALDENGRIDGDVHAPDLRESISDALRSASAAPFTPTVLTIGASDVFVEFVAPPQALVIFGGGPDVAPVVRIAKSVGWHVTVVAARPATGLPERFAAADRFLVTPADEPTAGVPLAADAAVVLMTHNFPRDLRVLNGLRFRPRYLGILGPRVRTRQLLAEARATGTIAHDAHGPVGLDLGAESPEEIALAIVAEIQAVARGAAAGFLRDRPGPIHERPGGGEGITAVTSPRHAATAGSRGATCPT